MKKMYKQVVFLSGALIFLFSSCKKNEPTVSFTYTVNKHEVVFKVQATDANYFEWDFGDGQTSEEENPTHVYDAGGEYDVTCKATGQGGSATATKTIMVDYSTKELLAGKTGKTWKISNASPASIVEINDANQNEKIDTVQLSEQFLAIFQLIEEYADEFTFKPDGSYSIDNKNGKSLGSISTAMQVLNLPDEEAVYNAHNQGLLKLPINSDDQNPTTEYHICSFNNTNLSGTWDIASDTITVNKDYSTFNLSKKYMGQEYIKLGNTNAFWGFYNKPNNQIRIKEITNDKLTVEFFIDSYETYPNIGTLLLTMHTIELTFVPVTN